MKINKTSCHAIIVLSLFFVTTINAMKVFNQLLNTRKPLAYCIDYVFSDPDLKTLLEYHLNTKLNSQKPVDLETFINAVTSLTQMRYYKIVADTLHGQTYYHERQQIYQLVMGNKYGIQDLQIALQHSQITETVHKLLYDFITHLSNRLQTYVSSELVKTIENSQAPLAYCLSQITKNNKVAYRLENALPPYDSKRIPSEEEKSIFINHLRYETLVCYCQSFGLTETFLTHDENTLSTLYKLINDNFNLKDKYDGKNPLDYSLKGHLRNVFQTLSYCINNQYLAFDPLLLPSRIFNTSIENGNVKKLQLALDGKIVPPINIIFFINDYDDNNETPIYVAIKCLLNKTDSLKEQYAQICELLIDHGADTDLKLPDERTCLDLFQDTIPTNAYESRIFFRVLCSDADPKKLAV